jgi:cell division protein FtsB
MRLLAVALILMIAAIQYPLWLGKGGWLRVRDLDREVSEQHAVNESLVARNAAVEAEVRDLKEGYAAVEERARTELGMIKSDEIFFQIIDRKPTAIRDTP